MDNAPAQLTQEPTPTPSAAVPQQPLQSNQPSNPPSHHIPKIVILGIGFIVLLLLTFGGYTVYKNLQTKEITPSFSPTIAQSSSTPTLPPTGGLTSDWETYSSQDFSFRYPSNWKLIKESDSFFEAIFLPENMRLNTGANSGGYQVSISTTPNPRKLSAEEVWKERIKEGTRTPEYIPVVINGFKGVKVSNNSLDSYDIRYYFANEKSIVLLSLNYYVEDYESAKKKHPDAEKIFDQILSTFKFTDQTTNSSNWKSYNGQYITFSYPPDWNPTTNDLFGGAVYEELSLGIPGIQSDQLIGFSSVEYENLVSDDVISEQPVSLDGKSGKKLLRKGDNYVSYDYQTKGYQNSGSFSIHVTVGNEDKNLESQLDTLVKSIRFK